MEEKFYSVLRSIEAFDISTNGESGLKRYLTEIDRYLKEKKCNPEQAAPKNGRKYAESLMFLSTYLTDLYSSRDISADYSLLRTCLEVLNRVALRPNVLGDDMKCCKFVFHVLLHSKDWKCQLLGLELLSKSSIHDFSRESLAGIMLEKLAPLYPAYGAAGSYSRKSLSKMVQTFVGTLLLVKKQTFAISSLNFLVLFDQFIFMTRPINNRLPLVFVANQFDIFGTFHDVPLMQSPHCLLVFSHECITAQFLICGNQREVQIDMEHVSHIECSLVDAQTWKLKADISLKRSENYLAKFARVFDEKVANINLERIQLVWNVSALFDAPVRTPRRSVIVQLLNRLKTSGNLLESSPLFPSKNFKCESFFIDNVDFFNHRDCMNLKKMNGAHKSKTSSLYMGQIQLHCGEDSNKQINHPSMQQKLAKNISSSPIASAAMLHVTPSPDLISPNDYQTSNAHGAKQNELAQAIIISDNHNLDIYDGMSVCSSQNSIQHLSVSDREPFSDYSQLGTVTKTQNKTKSSRLARGYFEKCVDAMLDDLRTIHQRMIEKEIDIIDHQLRRDGISVNENLTKSLSRALRRAHKETWKSLQEK